MESYIVKFLGFYVEKNVFTVMTLENPEGGQKTKIMRLGCKLFKSASCEISTRYYLAGSVLQICPLAPSLPPQFSIVRTCGYETFLSKCDSFECWYKVCFGKPIKSGIMFFFAIKKFLANTFQKSFLSVFIANKSYSDKYANTQ